jgi:hypothetical protein
MKTKQAKLIEQVYRRYCAGWQIDVMQIVSLVQYEARC